MENSYETLTSLKDWLTADSCIKSKPFMVLQDAENESVTPPV